MTDEALRAGPNILRQVTAPTALVVAILVGAAWYITWSTSDLMTALTAAPSSPLNSIHLALFFALISVMMVAMMLPSALPMIVAFHGMTRLEEGRPTKPADMMATVAFVLPYFLVWGAFGVAALLGLIALGPIGPLTGALALIPAVTLIATGAYQVTRVKEVCLSQCQSPLSFVINHWRAGLLGALQMGLKHAVYCLGCCWLFMVALFIVGSMSLVWMGALSLVIFVEKVGIKQLAFSRAIGILLIILGGVVAAQSFPLR